MVNWTKSPVSSSVLSSKKAIGMNQKFTRSGKNKCETGKIKQRVCFSPAGKNYSGDRKIAFVKNLSPVHQSDFRRKDIGCAHPNFHGVYCIWMKLQIEAHTNMTQEGQTNHKQIFIWQNCQNSGSSTYGEIEKISKRNVIEYCFLDVICLHDGQASQQKTVTVSLDGQLTISSWDLIVILWYMQLPILKVNKEKRLLSGH